MSSISMYIYLKLYKLYACLQLNLHAFSSLDHHVCTRLYIHVVNMFQKEKPLFVNSSFCFIIVNLVFTLILCRWNLQGPSF